MSLDTVAGVLLMFASSGLCLLFIFTGPKHGGFPAAPDYVRIGILIWAGMLLWRGSDLFELAGRPDPVAGRIDVTGMMAIFALVYLVGALVWWMAHFKLPVRSWSRLAHVFRSVRDEPRLVPVALTRAQVARELRAEGFPTCEAGEGPGAVGREGLPRARGE